MYQKRPKYANHTQAYNSETFSMLCQLEEFHQRQIGDIDVWLFPEEDIFHIYFFCVDFVAGGYIGQLSFGIKFVT